MIRRAAIVAGLTLTLGLVTGPALAQPASVATPAASPAGDTNGCIVIIPLEIAVCIPRF